MANETMRCSRCGGVVQGYNPPGEKGCSCRMRPAPPEGAIPVEVENNGFAHIYGGWDKVRARDSNMRLDPGSYYLVKRYPDE